MADTKKRITRKLTEAEMAVRLANSVLGRINADPDDDLAMLARSFLRERERGSGRSMGTAPRDGTHILAYLYQAPDAFEYSGFGEWREIWYQPHTMFGMNIPWHAGDPDDSHSGSPGPENFGEAVPIAWLPLPARPNVDRTAGSDERQPLVKQS